jgi:hydroxyacylglutathione hydrolase
MLEASPVRAFSDNYIWLVHSPVDRRQVVVVDPGDARPVEQHLEQHGLNLRAVLVTHHHPDHVGGVRALSERHRAQVLGPARESMPCAAQPLDDGERVSLMDLGLEFDVLDVPGHTRGHIAYVGHGALFCGDTLFSAGCGRLFEGTADQMYESLGRLSALPDETLVYCAHEYTLSNLRFAREVEPANADVAEAFASTTELRSRDEISLPSTIGREKKINPFLRSSQPSVRASAEQQAGRKLDRPVEVFATVRAWKDGFR